MEYKNEKHKLNCERWHFIRNFTRDEYISLNYRNKGTTRAWYECKACGRVSHFNKSNFKNHLSVCDNGCHGYCKGQNKVIKGVNDLATTRPDLVKYFVDQSLVYQYSEGSGVKVWVKCPNCGLEKKMNINILANKTFGCTVCGDGISYPEKFVLHLLQQLGVKFQVQFSLNNRKHKYDFYLPDYNTIIETHGGQHYKETHRKGARTLQEEQENDQIKKEIALQYGIKHYIVINSSTSKMEWMKKNIISSELMDLLKVNESNVDWLQIEANARGSLAKEVCTYFAQNNVTTGQIKKIFNISKSTIINYLKLGNELGWCTYDPKNEHCKAAKQASPHQKKPVKGIHLETGKVVTFSSARQAENWLKKHGKCSSISACCLGRVKATQNYVWSYITLQEYQDLQNGIKANVEQIPLITKHQNGNPVKGVNLETGKIVVFSSCNQAGVSMGKVNGSAINACCAGKKKSAYGYVWFNITKEEYEKLTKRSRDEQSTTPPKR